MTDSDTLEPKPQVREHFHQKVIGRSRMLQETTTLIHLPPTFTILLIQEADVMKPDSWRRQRKHVTLHIMI